MKRDLYIIQAICLLLVAAGVAFVVYLIRRKPRPPRWWKGDDI